MSEELQFCKCGCGEKVSKVGNRFINGHNSRGDGNPSKRDEVREKKSKSMKGRTFSDETRLKMSESAKSRQPFTDEHRANLSKSAKLRPPITDKTRAKLSRPKSDEHKLAISKAKTGVPRDPFRMNGNQQCQHHKLNGVKIQKKSKDDQK